MYDALKYVDKMPIAGLTVLQTRLWVDLSLVN